MNLMTLFFSSPQCYNLVDVRNLLCILASIKSGFKKGPYNPSRLNFNETHGKLVLSTSYYWKITCLLTSYSNKNLMYVVGYIVVNVNLFVNYSSVLWRLQKYRKEIAQIVIDYRCFFLYFKCYTWVAIVESECNIKQRHSTTKRHQKLLGCSFS